MKTNRPARGSAKPGEKWLYNNWDFNTVGVIVERALGAPFFEEFARRIASPLGMEDFRAKDGYEQFERTLSGFPPTLSGCRPVTWPASPRCSPRGAFGMDVGSCRANGSPSRPASIPRSGPAPATA